jgi:uncharacterized protein (TIGR03437 family)
MAFVFLLALLTDLGCNGATPDSSYPCYSAASIANSAAGIVNFYAPNTFISIYGQSLAINTVSISAEDLSSGMLPIALIGGEVVVLINNLPAYIWYVSPTLVNALIPANLIAGPATVQLEMDGKYGPPAMITLGATAPSLFQTGATAILATHADNSLVTDSSPAQPGEVIVLWATGLGPTAPPVIPNQVPETAAPLAAISQFQVLLNGVAVDPSRIYYAGATPTCAGLYQINLRLPDDTPANPEVRIGTADLLSPPGRFLAAQ